MKDNQDDYDSSSSSVTNSLRDIVDSIINSVTGGLKVCIASIFLKSILKKKLVTRPHQSAIAFAIYVSLFRLLNNNILNVKCGNKVRSILQPGIAAIGALLALPPNDRTVPITHAFIQAMVVCYKKCKITSKLSLEKWLLPIASGPLVNTWLISPRSFDPSHLKTLDHYSSLPQDTLRRFRTAFQTKNLKNSQVCNAIHVGQSCFEFHVPYYFPKVLYRSATVYVPLHFYLLVFRLWKSSTNLTTDSLVKALKAYVLTVIRSMLFLSTFYQVPALVSCVITNTSDAISHQWIATIAGAAGAAAINFENSASRRKSICAIVWTYSLVSIGRRVAAFLAKNQYYLRIPRRVGWKESKIRLMVDITIAAFSSVVIFSKPELQNASVMRFIKNSK